MLLSCLERWDAQLDAAQNERMHSSSATQDDRKFSSCSAQIDRSSSSYSAQNGRMSTVLLDGHVHAHFEAPLV
jgi:hypothetical protein